MTIRTTHGSIFEIYGNRRFQIVEKKGREGMWEDRKKQELKEVAIAVPPVRNESNKKMKGELFR